MTRKLLMMTLSLAAASSLWADKVYLKSGSYLTGTIESVSRDEITLNSDDLGKIAIKVANVAKIENVGEHKVVYNDGTSESKALAVDKGAYMTGAAALDMSNVKAIDPEPEKWHGSVNVAFNATRGNTFENSAAVVGDVNRRWEEDRLTANFGYYYGETGKAGTGSEKTTDRWEAEAKHDHFWSTSFYSYENLRYDRDMIQNLNARYRVGLGGGYQWLDGYQHDLTGKWSFNQEIGINWVKEEYRGPSDAKEAGFAALRYAHHLQFLPKFNPGIECFHNAEILPEVDEWEKYLVKADVGFSTKLIYDFDLLAKIEWDFDSMPAGGRKKSDLRYIVGFGYKW